MVVHVKKGKRAPRSRPMKDTKHRCKLHDTMQLDNILREKIQITRLSGHTRYRGAKMRAQGTRLKSDEIQKKNHRAPGTQSEVTYRKVAGDWRCTKKNQKKPQGEKHQEKT